MQPGNVDKNARPRPQGVPDGAYWDAGDNEWVLPERNSAGEFHGLVKWWRPDGTLCCATDHANGKPHGTFTRFHESGEPSRTGTFVNGALHGVNVFTRSNASTTENFPAGLGKQIWRCEMDFVDGRMTEGRLFDREGRRVMEDGTPFPTERPAGVPSSAHFRKPEGQSDYRWVLGETREIDGEWVRVGTWKYWTASGVLVREDPYEAGQLHGTLRIYDEDSGELLEEQLYDEGTRQFARPRGVPADATFDDDDETWTSEAPDGNGERRVWDASGVLRRSDTYKGGEVERAREFLADGSLGQDTTLIDGGVPRRKWFRRTPDEELESFPNVDPEDAREVEYQFDEHGRMTSFRITDENGTELEAEDVYRNAYGDEDQIRFRSIEDASSAWIEEGERYTGLINKWLYELYNQDEPSFEEPTFDRKDLERGVIDCVAQLNERGDGAQAHAKFPLYYDGIGKAFWDRYGLVVDRVVDTGAEIYARVVYPTSRPNEVMRITRDTIDRVDGVLNIGASHERVASPEGDKRYVAFAYEDRIEVQRGSERIALRYPTQYQHAGADALDTRMGAGSALGVIALRVCPNGQDVILSTAEGIYLVGRDRTQRLYPLDATLDEYVNEHEGGVFELAMRFPNADVSAAGDRITCGGMFKRGIFAGLAMFRKQGDRFELENTSQANAFFPMQAIWHRTRPHVAFAACLYASLSNDLVNTTFRIDLEGLPPGDISEFGGGIAQERGRVQVIASFGNGFLLGFNNGYIRWMGLDDNCELLGYVFVGGSIIDIDVAADEKSFVVASDSGLVSRFVMADKASSNLISTMPVVDDARVGFFRTWPPLRW